MWLFFGIHNQPTMYGIPMNQPLAMALSARFKRIRIYRTGDSDIETQNMHLDVPSGKLT
jgi:hypothetical protein